MPDPSISVADLSKRYTRFSDTPTLLGGALNMRQRTSRDQIWALRDVSFDVGVGESLGVLGRNGSGKSTLLRQLAGVSRPTEGRVRVTGRVAPLISVGVGFHPELTGRENVYVNGMILGIDRKEMDRRFDRVVAFAEIGDFIDTPVKFYSSGMFVRLGFAVAVEAQPDVLLVDEVLAVGDVAFQLKCFRRMEEIRERGTTVVVVTHNLTAVRNLTRRSIVLDAGRVAFDGDTESAIGHLHETLVGSSTSGEGEQAPLSVLDCWIEDGSGARSSHLRAGDEAVFHLRVRCDEPVSGAIFGVAVFAESGTPLYSDSSSWDGFGDIPAGAVVDFAMRAKMRLGSGTYEAALGVRSNAGVDLHVPAQPQLFYVAGRPYVIGVLDLEGEIEINRQDGMPASEPVPGAE